MDQLKEILLLKKSTYNIGKFNPILSRTKKNYRNDTWKEIEVDEIKNMHLQSLIPAHIVCIFKVYNQILIKHKGKTLDKQRSYRQRLQNAKNR